MEERATEPDEPTAVPDAADATEPASRDRWTALFIVVAGTSMVILDTTIVNVALPQIAKDLGGSNGIEWVVTGYLLGVAIAQPISARLAERFGRKQLFIGALSTFTLASLCAALSPTLGVLIACRVVQGLGGGMISPVGLAIIYEIFPTEERGRATGVWGLANMAAPALGPVLGGYLVTAVSWHWLFLVNVPIGIACLVFAARRLHAGSSTRRPDAPIHLNAIALGGGGLALTLLGLSQANDWGWGSLPTLVCLVGGISAVLVFARMQMRSRDPVLDFAVFRARDFRITTTMFMMVISVQFTRHVFMPLQLETLRGYTPLKVGLLLTPAAITTAVSMTLGGRLADRASGRTSIMIGSSIMVVSSLLLATLTLDTSDVVIMAFVALQGFGMGFVVIPAIVVGLNSLPAHLYTQGTTWRALTAQVAAATNIAVMTALLGVVTPENASLQEQQSAFNTLFFAGAILAAMGMLTAARLPRRTAVGPTTEIVIVE